MADRPRDVAAFSLRNSSLGAGGPATAGTPTDLASVDERKALTEPEPAPSGYVDNAESKTSQKSAS